ncbi:hypothetical protein KM043_007759 [Ampulex compressa]|nr:hypothetical protein KM043_007759 [Ampulex compressa]
MAQETDDINLTPQELQILSELDSRQFGFLKLNSPEQSKKKALVVRAIKYLERMLVQAQAEKQRRKADSTKINPEELKDDDGDKGISIDPKTYCKLGHFHLLLEDYNKAMSAYQKFYSLKGDYWTDTSFLYGQGLVYFHFNAFQCNSTGEAVEVLSGLCNPPPLLEAPLESATRHMRLRGQPKEDLLSEDNGDNEETDADSGRRRVVSVLLCGSFCEVMVSRRVETESQQTLAATVAAPWTGPCLRVMTSLGSGAVDRPIHGRHVIACLRFSDAAETASHVTSQGTARHAVELNDPADRVQYTDDGRYDPRVHDQKELLRSLRRSARVCPTGKESSSSCVPRVIPLRPSSDPFALFRHSRNAGPTAARQTGL